MRAPRLVALLALAFASLSASNLSAQTTVSTTPVGAVTLTVAASSNGTTYTVSQVAVPLVGDPLVSNGVSAVTPSGLLKATVSSATTNQVTTTSAGWTVGQLAQASFPLFVKFTSGSQSGLTLLITANTDTTLTLDNRGIDLSGLTGSSYTIIAGDTLVGLFGTGTVAGSNDVRGGTATNFAANQTDRVTINTSGTVINYYFNTQFNQWRRSGSSASQDNVVISPQAGVVYSRIATTPLSVVTLGTVPTGSTKIPLTSQGLEIIGRQFPSDTTLASLNIQNVSNWRKANTGGVTVATSDRVLVNVSGALLSFYFNNTTGLWQRSGSGADQGGVVISAADALRIQRSGSVGTDFLTISPNYSF